MACSSTDAPIQRGAKPDYDGGFATVAAMAITLALGLTMGASLLGAQVSLASANRAMERSQMEYALDVVQTREAHALHQDPSKTAAPFDQTGTLPEGGQVHLEVATEDRRRPVSSAASLPDAWFKALGVTRVLQAKAALSSASGDYVTMTLERIADIDPSPLWRACAPEFLSAYGAPTSPDPDRVLAGLPIVVRLTATSMDGWRDERIVRLTNDSANPTVVLDRRFGQVHGSRPTCPSEVRENSGGENRGGEKGERQ